MPHRELIDFDALAAWDDTEAFLVQRDDGGTELYYKIGVTGLLTKINAQRVLFHSEGVSPYATLTGSIDGVNKTFSVGAAFVEHSLRVFYNGVLIPPSDIDSYNTTTGQVVLTFAPAINTFVAVEVVAA